MHHWGQTDFDWASLDKAIDFIDTNLVRWGRVNVMQAKEKFGTCRIYCHFGWYQFHSITHPRSHFSRYPKWLWEWDCTWGHRILKPIQPIVYAYHKWLYRTLYKIACDRYPHIVEEICVMADYVELLDFYTRRKNGE